jgi:hypothetical protein
MSSSRANSGPPSPLTQSEITQIQGSSLPPGDLVGHELVELDQFPGAGNGLSAGPRPLHESDATPIPPLMTAPSPDPDLLPPPDAVPNQVQDTVPNPLPPPIQPGSAGVASSSNTRNPPGPPSSLGGGQNPPPIENAAIIAPITVASLEGVPNWPDGPRPLNVGLRSKSKAAFFGIFLILLSLAFLGE